MVDNILCINKYFIWECFKYNKEKIEVGRVD